MDYLDFLKWLEQEQIESKFNCRVQSTNKSSKVYYGSEVPVILMNREDLNSSFWKGTFFHELGHVIRPPSQEIVQEFKTWKIIELGQILLLPIWNLITQKYLMPLGLDYVWSMVFLLYGFKILCNYTSYPVSLYLYDMEYQADKFSHKLDENKSLWLKMRSYRYKLLARDLWVRICPVFILWTHPLTILREKNLEKRS